MMVKERNKRKSTCRKKPILFLTALIKLFSGSAYVFTNMYEPQTGKRATFKATFPGATSVTVYRMGEVTEIGGDTLKLTLENREGVFVTVQTDGRSGAAGSAC